MRLICFLLFCILGTTQATSTSIALYPIALLPLDSRPTTSSLPTEIANASNLELFTPAQELLGTNQQAANHEALEKWISMRTEKDLVVSLDALAYGGLVQSRKSTISDLRAWQNLQVLRQWHIKTGGKIYAFVVIPRAPDAQNRQRNLLLIRRAMAWAQDKTLARLAITWDDALPGSPAPQEGQVFLQDSQNRNIQNIFVSPGADEVASTLLSFVALQRISKTPKVKIVFSNPSTSNKIALYDGQPLQQSVNMQITAAGATGVAPGPADFTLFVFNGGDTRQAAVQISVLSRRGPVALADVSEVNKAASQLVNDLVTLNRFMQLRGFAAWGTPSNNLGTAVAQASLGLYSNNTLAASKLLLREYINDYLYGTVLRPQIRQKFKDTELNNQTSQDALLALLQKSFSAQTISKDFCTSIKSASFPWGRSFEIAFELNVISKDPDSSCDV